MLDRLKRWMIGRRGLDQLSMGLLGLYLVLTTLHVILRWDGLLLLALVVMVWCCFRMYSRNLARREQENQVFLRMFAPIGNKLRGWSVRLKEQKTHRFFHCPQCHQTLRVPKGKGKITITCPKCSRAFIKKT